MLENDVAYRSPEVAPVGGEGVCLVGVYISFLRGLDVFKGDGGVFVVVEGGQEPRLDADMQVLHLGRVKAEIMPAQRPYADELHLALEDVDEHRQLVEPELAEQPSPAVDAVVVGEFAAVLEPLVLKHVGLEVLRVGVHRTELIDSDEIALVAYPRQLD